MDMNNNTTIVTALFDIGRDEWDTFTMSYNTYLFWMANTLSLDCNMVIYTEKKFKERITTYRSIVDPTLSKTKIIITTVSEIHTYKQFNNQLEQLMYSDNFKAKSAWNNVPEMTKPLYNIIMFSKLWFLEDTLKNNYFDNQKFLIWADAGGLREDIKQYTNIVWPDESKIDSDNITFFSHHSTISIHDKQSHAISQMRFIQGTCFIVPAKLVTEFYNGFNEIVESCISQEYIGSDEKLLDFYYLSNSNKCKLIKCDWREYYKILQKDLAST